MEKLFVSYLIALELKNKGFNEECMARWFKVGDEKPIFILNTSPSNENNDIITIAPLYQQVILWFWEKKGIPISIYYKNHFWYNNVSNSECRCNNITQAYRDAIQTALKLI